MIYNAINNRVVFVYLMLQYFNSPLVWSSLHPSYQFPTIPKPPFKRYKIIYFKLLFTTKKANGIIKNYLLNHFLKFVMFHNGIIKIIVVYWAVCCQLRFLYYHFSTLVGFYATFSSNLLCSYWAVNIVGWNVSFPGDKGVIELGWLFIWHFLHI